MPRPKLTLTEQFEQEKDPKLSRLCHFIAPIWYNVDRAERPILAE